MSINMYVQNGSTWLAQIRIFYYCNLKITGLSGTYTGNDNNAFDRHGISIS